MTAALVLGAVVLVSGVIVALSAKVVGPNEQLVIFRMGRTSRALVHGPGLAFLIPVIDHPVRVDMSERTYQLVDIRAVTQDGRPIAVDATLRGQVVDAYTCTVNVAFLDGALPGVLETIIRSTASERPEAVLLAGRREFEQVVLERLRVPGDRWAVAIAGLELTDVRRIAD